MIKNILAALAIFTFYCAGAETVKTDVLVIGGSPGGAAAAMQCARSKVKTVFAYDEIRLAGNGMVRVNTNRNIPSGAWG
jgi:thioredoxin reductase